MPPKGTTGIKCRANGRRGKKAEQNSGNRDAGHRTPRGRRTLSEEKERTRSVNNKKGIAPQVNDQKPHMDGRRIDANNMGGQCYEELGLTMGRAKPINYADSVYTLRSKRSPAHMLSRTPSRKNGSERVNTVSLAERWASSG